MLFCKNFNVRMKEAKTFFGLLSIVVLLGVSGQPAGAGGIEAMQNNIYEAYVLSDIPLWERTLDDMKAMYARIPSNGLLYDMLLAQYGLIGYYLGTDQNAQARAHLDVAEGHASRLAGVAAYEVTAWLFQSAFLAFRINLRPMQAVRLGPRSYRLIDQAMEADPGYARVWVEKANAAFYTPSVFGGDRPGSVGHYQEAIRLFEAGMANNHRWLYLSTLVALANAQKANGDLAGAIRTLEKALRFEPRFGWVRDELLPEYRRSLSR